MVCSFLYFIERIKHFIKINGLIRKEVAYEYNFYKKRLQSNVKYK